jgi:hypothetical protein
LTKKFTFSKLAYKTILCELWVLQRWFFY